MKAITFEAPQSRNLRTESMAAGLLKSLTSKCAQKARLAAKATASAKFAVASGIAVVASAVAYDATGSNAAWCVLAVSTLSACAAIAAFQSKKGGQA